MVVCHFRLMRSTVCSYPMVMSQGSMSLMFFTHVTGLCIYWTGVSGVGSTGAVRANATIHLSEGPVRDIGHADMVRERVKRGEGGANGEDILFTTVSFSGVVCRHVHRSVSPT